MRGRALILGLLLALVAPATAEAQRPHRHHARHHARHALRHHHAHKSEITGCEGPSDPVTWTEWRQDMAAAGFTPEETAELEACGEEGA